MSLPVTRRMVAMWLQFRAAVAGPGIWQQVDLPTARVQSTRSRIWCSALVLRNLAFLPLREEIYGL
jgi:hypothetical protein